jgi:hypothetical protein
MTKSPCCVGQSVHGRPYAGRVTCARYLSRRRLSEWTSAELSRRVERVVGYPPLVEMDDSQRREFHEALLDADRFEDLPGKWQAAIVAAEQNRPKLRIISSD